MIDEGMENVPASKAQETGWLAKPQKRLGSLGLIVMLTLANTIIPFTTDMYTPALPSLPEYFSAAEATVNLTILLFFLTMTVSVLCFGPVSDRFGRKPVLVGGLTVYTCGCLLCSFAWDIFVLIAFRVVQGVGAGATVAVSMALVKDCFTDHRREQMLAILQVLGVVGPVAAPLFGGIILSFFTWHAVFVALGILGAVSLGLALLFEETLPAEERRTGGILGTLHGLVEVSKNHSFMMLLLVSALFSLPFMAYITAASYIYIDYFGGTPQIYSYYFALSAAISTTGPIIWLQCSKFTTPRVFTHFVIGITLLSGILIMTIGQQSATLFCIAFTLFALATNAIRPYVTNILLAQQAQNAGSASSLINFMNNVFGVFGMALIGLPWSSYVVGLAIITIVCVALIIFVWVTLLTNKHFYIEQLQK